MATPSLQSKTQLTSQSTLVWRTTQSIVWFIGLAIVFNLFFYPTLGIHLFWNILIPIAPLLLVLATGVWRNVCPMASTALFPRYIGLSRRIKLTTAQSGKLYLASVILLFLIVPLRHLVFNTSGLATGILILSLALFAIVMGLLFEWKSGWCSGLCPVHPVEKLYGQNNRLSLPNIHCDKCYRCVTPCPDSTPAINPVSSKKTAYHRIAGFLMTAAFPGFIWGWFQVPDYEGSITFIQLVTAYKFPFIGILIASGLFLILKRFLTTKKLIAIFSALAVSCYYWYRLPALIGFGIFPNDGMLIDLSHSIPKWVVSVIIITTTLFFFWWIVFRKQKQISWGSRPAYAKISRNKTSLR